MRYLVILVGVLAACYGGYWFVGRAALDRGIDRLIAELRTDGWEIGFDRIETHGFPSRFDTTVTGPTATSPDEAVTWRAPFFQLLALSYRPTQVIAVWPNEQELDVFGVATRVTSETLRASISVRPGPTLEPDRATLEGDVVTLAADHGRIAIDRLIASMRPGGGAENTYEFYLGVEDAVLAGDPLKLPEALRLPAASLDAIVRFDRPLDRRTLGAQPRIARIDLQSLDLQLDGIGVSGQGAVTMDAGGPDGVIELSVENWQGALVMAEESGIIDPAAIGAARVALRLVSLGDDDVTLPLTIEDGLVSLGPVPLGQVAGQ